MLRSPGITTLALSPTLRHLVWVECLVFIVYYKCKYILIPSLSSLVALHTPRTNLALIPAYKCSNCYFFVVKNAHKWLLLLLPDWALFEIICCSSCVECEEQGTNKKHITPYQSFLKSGSSQTIIIKTFVNQCTI